MNFTGLHFHICLWQHGRLGIATMQDNIDALRFQCADLGITTTVDYIEGQPGYRQIFGPNNPNVFNIFVECFNRELAHSAVEASKRFNIILICTERPSPGGWNAAGQDPDIARRWAWYKHVAPHIKGQWCFVPGASAVLKRWNANSVDLDLGWSRIRESRVDEVLATIPDYDDPPHAFGFYGGLTDDRRDLFEGFAKLGTPVLTRSTGRTTAPGKIDKEDALKNDYGDLKERNYLAAKCKVILHPSAFRFDPKTDTGKQWGIFSTSRGITALDLRRPLVAEPTRPTIWQDIVEFSPRPGLQSFHETAMKVLADWKGHRDRQRTRFRELLSPELTLGRAVQETIINQRMAA